MLFPSLQPNKERFSREFGIERTEIVSDSNLASCIWLPYGFSVVAAITAFFTSLDELQAVTLNLQAYPNRFACHNCQRSEHFVSHGFSYAKAHAAKRATVGKRLFCANRFGRGGCGATLRLYLFERLPRLQVGAPAMQAFLTHLDQGMAVESAYAQSRPEAQIVPCAAPQLEKTMPPLLPHRSSRNAWRWLKKLDRNLPRFRALLAGPEALGCLPFATRSARLRLLLPSFAALRSKLGAAFVGAFQCTQQAAFLT